MRFVMRFVLTILAVLTLAAYVVFPTRADAATDTTSMTCAMDRMAADSMDMTTIQSLRDCVVHAYDAGHIANQGVEASLLRLVDAAQIARDSGGTSAAVRSLNAFISLVRAQSGLTIDAAYADCLVMHATTVIQALKG